MLAERAYALLRLAQLRTNLQTRLSDVEHARTLLASIPQLPSVALILRQEAVKLDTVSHQDRVSYQKDQTFDGLSAYEQAAYPAVLPIG